MKTPAALLLLALLLTGCASAAYTAPGPGADMARFGAATPEQQATLSDYTIQQIRQRQPLARFPVSLVVARVQGDGYASYTNKGYGTGSYSVVTNRDVEPEDAIERLNALPMVRGVAPVGRLILPPTLKDDRELRAAAATVHGDMLLVYTIDTDITTDDGGSPLDVVTLGFLPHQEVRVNSTASSVLMDVGNGYVYGIAEGSADHKQRANTWTSEEAADEARRKAETEAVANMLDAFETTWQGVVARYATPYAAGGTAPAATPSAAAPPGAATSVAVSPPAQTPAPGPQAITLDLTPDGTYRLGPEPLTQEQLRVRLARLATQQPEPRILLRASTETPMERVMAAMDLLKQAGIENVGITTSHSP